MSFSSFIVINVEIVTPLFCDVGNENGGENDSFALLSSSHLNEQQETNLFMDIENELRDDFSFPQFPWS